MKLSLVQIHLGENKSMMRKLIIFLMAILLFAPVSAQQKNQQNRLKVGLVLGGGGAKGAAEVGVLKVIEEVGIPIDYIAGTSIGSIVGGLYSCGYRSAELDSLFSSQEWINLLSDRNISVDEKKMIQKKDGITYLFGFPVAKKDKNDDFDFGVMKGDSIVALLYNKTNRPDSMSFDSLPIPFRCVAVDLKTFKEYDYKSGVLAEAMRASMSIPGAFKTVKKDTMELIDGGALNNLPVDVCKAMGADVIIAVDLTQNHRAPKNKPFNLKKRPIAQMIEWAQKRPDLIKYNENIKNCDIYINPDLKGMTAADFNPRKIQEMISRGREAGLEAKADLIALKNKIGSVEN